jgi:GT2 family glycosyltransferase
VPSFQRFDLDGTPSHTIITDREMKRRWASFHGDMRSLSGTWLQRTLGRVLGENTWRYKSARLVGRPVLRTVRKVRKIPPKIEIDRERAARATAVTTVFPANYEPRFALRYVDDATTIPLVDDVAVVVVNESSTSPTQIVDALNETIAITTSTWLLIMDVERTGSDRVRVLTALLNRATATDDVVFADETGTNSFTPLFKSPSVGPHTLLSYNVVGRPALLRISTLQRVGGFSTDAGWAFEHDIYLRLSEAGATFRHLSLVLPGGRPAHAFEGAHINEDTSRVVLASLDRRGWVGKVIPGPLDGVVRWILDVPTPYPSIDIIIPTRDRVDLVRQCIEAIEQKTTYPNYDIIILNNDSVKPETLEYFATTKYRVVACPGPFNYAHIVNRGVSHSAAQYIVTLNNDTILVTPDWLERMVSMASLPEVGFVGACLLDQEGRREHESIIIAPYPQHLRTDSNYPHIDQFTSSVRDVAAVTGAVQMVERELWNHLGGMDEQLKVTMNDVDICLRGQLEGRNVIYDPDVRLFHHVSSSRGDLDPLEDRNRFIRRWDIFGSFRDPYFPEALLLMGETIYYLPRSAGKSTNPF